MVQIGYDNPPRSISSNPVGENRVGPVAQPDDLASSSSAVIKAHIEWELRRLLSEERLTQEQLAHKLAYGSGSQINKILRGSADLPPEKARRLDELKLKTALGVGFARLVQERVSRERGRRYGAGSGRYDIFLAMPMASAANPADFARTRDTASDMVRVMTDVCGFSVYCAALDVSGMDDFDSASFALRDNVSALLASRHFVLWVTDKLEKPSSIWVEIGMALAMEKPCTVLAPGPDVLPYVLQQAQASAIPRLGPVRFEWTNGASAVSLLRRHGRSLFGQEARTRAGL